MTKEELETLKLSGAHDAMHKGINHKLWTARQLLDEAQHDAYKHFAKKIEQAQQDIADAVQIRNEMLRIPKAKK